MALIDCCDTWRFRRRKLGEGFALLLMLFMWLFQQSLLFIVTPKYLLPQNVRCDHVTHTVLPQLDALHALDAAAHFDAGWSGRNRHLQNSTFKLTPVLLLTLGMQHTIC